MPWHIEKGGGTCAASKWAVIKDSDGSTASCHDTEAKAKAQLAALHASENKNMDSLNISELIFSIPARVLLPDAQRQADLLAIIKDRHVLDPKILEEHQLFTWDAEISSDLIDSHFTHMLPNTLANFREDARDGVAFLLGHNHRELPSGRSFNAELEQATNPARTRVVASFYTLLGMTVNGIKTDDIVSGMRGGLTRDNSVGFFGGDHVCDIDGMSYWSWDCPHIPGKRYEITKDGITSMVVSTFSVSNARLAEVSGVFAGSTPNAEILKAEREAEIGRIDPDVARYIEQRYRVKLPASKRAFAGVEVPGQKPREEEYMSGETKAMTMDDADHEKMMGMLDEMKEMLGKATKREREQLTITDVLADLSFIRTALTPLQARASDGDTYRNDLVTEALAEGVRANGDKFALETYERTLRASPLDVIKQMRDDWKRAGDARFAGGRQTTDGDGTPRSEPVKLTPDMAYRS